MKFRPAYTLVAAALAVLPAISASATTAPTGIGGDLLEPATAEFLNGVAQTIDQLGQTFPAEYGGEKIEDGTLIVFTTSIDGAFAQALAKDDSLAPADIRLQLVENSLAEMLQLVKMFRVDNKMWSDLRLTQVGPDLDENKVVVYLEKYSLEAAEKLLAHYGTRVLRVATDDLPPASTDHRFNDTAPFTSSDRWYMHSASGTSGCTGGFAFDTDLSTELMLSTGHCTTGNGYIVEDALGNVAVNGQGWSLCNYCMDSMLFRVDARASVWTGGANTTTRRSVTAYYLFEVQGEHFCTDGATTNNVECDVIITGRYIDKLYNDGFWRTNLTKGEKDGAMLSQGGDSGGPIYSRTANDTVKARGMIISHSGNDHDIVFYQPIADLIDHYSRPLKLAS